MLSNDRAPQTQSGMLREADFSGVRLKAWNYEPHCLLRFLGGYWRLIVQPDPT